MANKSLETKVKSELVGFSSEIIFSKSIPELYGLLKIKLDKLSDIIGFEEIDICVSVDSDLNLTPTTPELTTIYKFQKIYNTSLSDNVMKYLETQFDPKDIIGTIFQIPFQTNEVFETPRSEKNIRLLIEKGSLPSDYLDQEKADYETFKERRRLSKKPIPSRESYRHSLLVPIIFDNKNFGQAGFSLLVQDPKKYPKLTILGDDDYIPEEYKEILIQTTSELTPYIFTILKLYKEYDKNEKLKEANEKLDSTMLQLMHYQQAEKDSRKVANILHTMKNYLQDIIPNTENYFKLLIKFDETITALEEGKKPSNLNRLRKDFKNIKDEIHPIVLKAYEWFTQIYESFDRAYRPRVREQNINTSLSDLVVLNSQEFIQRDIDLRMDVEEIGKFYFKGNPHEIFDNIMTNAEDAVMEMKKQNPDYRGKVLIKAYIKDGKKIVEIHDNGIGIKPENETNLFQREFTTKEKGRGIGLHFCKYFVEIENKGKIYYQKSHLPEYKTCFTVELN